MEAHTPIRARIVRRFRRRLHGLASGRPLPVVFSALALATAGAWAYYGPLDVVPARSALTDDSTGFNRRARAYEREFGDREDPLVLVVRAGDPDGTPLPEPSPAEREAMKEVANRWAEALAARPDLFGTARARLDPAEMGPWGLLYLPMSDVNEVAESASEAIPLLREVVGSPSIAGAVSAVSSAMDTLSPPAEGRGGRLRDGLGILESGFRHLRIELEGGKTEGGDELRFLPTTGSFDPDGFFFTPDGRLLTAVATPVAQPDGANRFEEPLAVARRALEEALRAVPGDVTVAAGLAGEPALEEEETRITRRDFGRSAAIALVAVSLLFMWSFRSVLRPGLAALCLGTSIATTFLFAWLAIGHLNVLAMVFAVILVALGIDFAIHFYVHYRRGLADGLGPGGAIRRTYRQIGGALWMDGVATAGAFLVAWFTDFPGLSELGVIAGTGLLICLATMYVVFPALLFLLDRRVPGPDTPPRLLGRIPATASPPGRWGRAALVGGLLVAAAGFLFGEHDLDTNVLELQPEQGPANRWQRLLLDTDDRTQFTLATYDDPSRLERVRARLERLPEVRRTEAALPGHEDEKRQALAGACRRVRGVEVRLDGAPAPPELRRSLFGLRQTVRRYARSGPEAEEALAGLQAEVDGLYRVLGELEDSTARRRLSAVQADARETLVRWIELSGERLCPPPLRLSDVPPPLARRYIGAEGTLALRIYPVENTWEEGPRRRFLQAVRSVEPEVFKGVVGFHENTLVMIRSFLQAAVYSSVAIVLLLLLWTRSVRRTLLALFPLVLGLGFLLAAMEWAVPGLTWNLGNFFAVPILIGIGVAGGVHMVRGWELGRDSFRGAVGAVTLSALTTMIGFGLLATGEHRGVASLGVILLLGIAFNLLAAVVLLPLALRLASSPSTVRGGHGQGTDATGSTTRGSLMLLALLPLAIQAVYPPAVGAQPGPPTGAGTVEEEPTTFLMVKPGDPAATPERATAFLERMAEYLGRTVDKLSEGTVEGRITNRIDEGVEILRNEEPPLVFVPPGFYLAHLREASTRARPVAWIPRFEASVDRFYLVTAADGPTDVRALRGRRVAGTDELDRAYLERVVFPDSLRPGEAFLLESRENLSDEIFLMLEDEADAPTAVLLDEELKRFYETDDLVWPELRILWRSEPLPRDLAVAVGEWSEDALADLREALFSMPSDPVGRELLELMSSTGLEPVDEALLERVRRAYDEGR